MHLTRNEKVACSSQVTSSKKAAVFNAKTAVFLTFSGAAKAPVFCLALIWRYFFEAVIFKQNWEIDKLDFLNFFIENELTIFFGEF